MVQPAGEALLCCSFIGGLGALNNSRYICGLSVRLHVPRSLLRRNSALVNADHEIYVLFFLTPEQVSICTVINPAFCLGSMLQSLPGLNASCGNGEYFLHLLVPWIPLRECQQG